MTTMRDVTRGTVVVMTGVSPGRREGSAPGTLLRRQINGPIVACVSTDRFYLPLQQKRMRPRWATPLDLSPCSPEPEDRANRVRDQDRKGRP